MRNAYFVLVMFTVLVAAACAGDEPTPTATSAPLATATPPAPPALQVTPEPVDPSDKLVVAGGCPRDIPYDDAFACQWTIRNPNSWNAMNVTAGLVLPTKTEVDGTPQPSAFVGPQAIKWALQDVLAGTSVDVQANFKVTTFEEVLFDLSVDWTTPDGTRQSTKSQASFANFAQTSALILPQGSLLFVGEEGEFIVEINHVGEIVPVNGLRLEVTLPDTVEYVFADSSDAEILVEQQGNLIRFGRLSELPADGRVRYAVRFRGVGVGRANVSGNILLLVGDQEASVKTEQFLVVAQ